jgi:hypothetical protein
MTDRQDRSVDVPGFTWEPPRNPEPLASVLAGSGAGFRWFLRAGLWMIGVGAALIFCGYWVHGGLRLLCWLVGPLLLAVGLPIWWFGNANLRDQRRLLLEGTALHGSVVSILHRTQSLGQRSARTHEGPYVGGDALLERAVRIEYGAGSSETRVTTVTVASHEAMPALTTVIVLVHERVPKLVGVLGPVHADGVYGLETGGAG